MCIVSLAIAFSSIMVASNVQDVMDSPMSVSIDSIPVEVSDNAFTIPIDNSTIPKSIMT